MSFNWSLFCSQLSQRCSGALRGGDGTHPWGNVICGQRSRIDTNPHHKEMLLAIATFEEEFRYSPMLPYPFTLPLLLKYFFHLCTFQWMFSCKNHCSILVHTRDWTQWFVNIDEVMHTNRHRGQEGYHLYFAHLFQDFLLESWLQSFLLDHYTSVLDFWWCLPWVSRPDWIACLVASSPA